MLKRLGKYLMWLVAFFFASTILVTIIYRFLPVYVTPLMFIRTAQQITDGESPTWHHTWISLEEMPKSLPVAVMAIFPRILQGKRLRTKQHILAFLTYGHLVTTAVRTIRPLLGHGLGHSCEQWI